MKKVILSTICILLFGLTACSNTVRTNPNTNPNQEGNPLQEQEAELTSPIQ